MQEKYSLYINTVHKNKSSHQLQIFKRYIALIAG